MTVAEMATLSKEVNECASGLQNELKNMREQCDETIYISEYQVEQLLDCLLSVEHLITGIFNNLVIPGTESR